MQNNYFSFQGLLSLGTAGSNEIEEYEVGNCPEFSVELSTETLEHKESWSGQRLTDLRLVKENRASVKLVLESWSLDNLALGLYGQVATRPPGSATNEPLGTVAIDRVYPLAQPFGVSAVVLKDATTPTPTIIPAAKYEVDAQYGLIKFLDTAGFTQPVTASYSYGPAKNVAMFMRPPAARRLRLRAKNTASGNAAALIELWRVQFDPVANLSMITDELGRLELSGSVLADPVKVADPLLGAFGRIIQA